MVMKISVTGATGFIGRHLVNTLIKAGHSVRALSRVPPNGETSFHRSVEWIQGDLHSPTTLKQLLQGVQAVAHCAGEYQNEEKFFYTNVQGTQNLYQMAISEKVHRFVHLSSVGVYGQIRKGEVEEDHPYRAMNA